MGIASIGSAVVGSLLPTYTPQNVFSFGFYYKSENGSYDITDPTGAEYFFVNGPLSYTENFKFRTSIEKTFGGGSVVIDYGEDNHEIKLEGEFHIYFRGLPAKPKSGFFGSGNGFFQSAMNGASSVFGGYVDAIRSNYLNIGGGGFRSGLQEFQDFMFFLNFSKNLDQTLYSSNDPQGQKVVSFFKDVRLNWKDVAFVFRDYDRNRIVEVVLPQTGFTISRSVSDTNTYKYSLTLIVVKNLETSIKSQNVRSNFNPFRTISGLMNELENLVNLPLNLSGALLNVGRFANGFANSALRLKTSWGRMQNQFNLQGRLARKEFNTASSILNGKSRGFSSEEISNSIDESYLKSRSIEADFRQSLSSAKNDLERLNSAIASSTIPISGNSNLSAASLSPNADFTSWIDNEAYNFVIIARDILIEIEAAINFAAIDDGFKIRLVLGGETYTSIAKSDLGNSELGQALAYYNNESDPSTITRAAIKVPFKRTTNVFTTLLENFTQADLEKALIGTDIKLNSNRGIEVSPNGDLAVVEGDEALVNETLDLLDIPIGSLPANISLGNPIPIGELPDELIKSGYILKLLNQIRSDNRVKEAEYLGVTQNGDEYIFYFKITSITGGSFILKL